MQTKANQQQMSLFIRSVVKVKPVVDNLKFPFLTSSSSMYLAYTCTHKYEKFIFNSHFQLSRFRLNFSMTQERSIIRLFILYFNDK